MYYCFEYLLDLWIIINYSLYVTYIYFLFTLYSILFILPVKCPIFNAFTSEIREFIFSKNQDFDRELCKPRELVSVNNKILTTKFCRRLAIKSTMP